MVLANLVAAYILAPVVLANLVAAYILAPVVLANLVLALQVTHLVVTRLVPDTVVIVVGHKSPLISFTINKLSYATGNTLNTVYYT